MSKHIKVSDLPSSLQAALKSVGFRRADIDVSTATQYYKATSGGRGSRGFQVVVNLDNGTKTKTVGAWGGYNPFVTTSDDDRTHADLAPNLAVIDGSEGGNRPVWATLTLHPDNTVLEVPTAPTAAVNATEAKVLAIFKGLKSFARLPEMERQGISPDILETLVDRGYLKRNKRGATSLTTEGKNLAAATYY